MICKICGKTVEEKFKGIVLQKYEVKYFQCTNCNFIQTDYPFWLEEAYKNPITNLDIGLVNRNLLIKESVRPLLLKVDSKGDIPYLDVGGGYGLFVRLMRDIGLDFYLYDPHCENLFAKGFSKNEEELHKEKFQAITAFEVLEHTENPYHFFMKYKSLTKTFIFSTELIPKKELNSTNDWWYFAPETGQHVSFFSAKSLHCLAGRIGFRYYSDGNFLHCFSSKSLPENPFKGHIIKRILTKVGNWLIKKDNKDSLLQVDFQKIKAQLDKNEGSF